jgi:hypothetical protein
MTMALYELRTYTLYVGKMAEATKLYQELGYPALEKGGHSKHLIGYFQGDTGTINQIVHLWKYDDDAGRRAHWDAVAANKDFNPGFTSKFRPLVMTQEVKLLHAAPWGPHPRPGRALVHRTGALAGSRPRLPGAARRVHRCQRLGGLAGHDLISVS